MNFRKFIVLTLMACLLLTGCVDTKITVNIDENNGGTVTMRVLMEESVHAKVFSDDGLSSGLEDFTQGDKFVGDDGKTYIPFTKTDTYATYDEMVEGLMSIESLVSENDGGTGLNPDQSVEATNNEDNKPTADKPDANATDKQDANTSDKQDANTSDKQDANATDNSDKSDANTVENTEEAKDKATATLFSDVAITKFETTTGYTYTFRAILKKQGDDKPAVEPNEATTADTTTADGTNTDATANEGVSDGTASGLEAIATDINNMFKVELEIVLPVDIQDYAGGMVQGNTLICDIRDLSVDTEIYATGERIVEPVVEEVEDELYPPEVTHNQATSGITTYFMYVMISMALIGTATAIILGIMKLTKRK